MDPRSEMVALDCPYCGVRQTVLLKRTARPQVVLCDIEQVPGCDRYFVVTLTMHPEVQYYTISEEKED